jgi:propanol-preferring alcohol dehydrogenase
MTSVATRPATMTAMQVVAPGRPLIEAQLPVPDPGPDQVLVRVRTCGVCRTDLHVADGDLTQGIRPVTPGHEIVGVIVATGARASGHRIGQRVGIPWLGHTCGECALCRSGRENLCPQARFTGYHIHGGYAQYAVADARFCFALPDAYSDAAAAPLLCAGLIGYRALRMAGDASVIGIYGFGAAAHIVAQVARFQGRTVYAFTREGDHEAQDFARSLGAQWAGHSGQRPPRPLDAALIFAPVGALVPMALQATAPGGTVVCAGIHMSDIPGFPYRMLWEERCIRSVANLTRRDGEEFLALAPQVPVRTATERFSLGQANEALQRLRAGQLRGAAVLDCA